jgi:hypothetical protein
VAIAPHFAAKYFFTSLPRNYGHGFCYTQIIEFIYAKTTGIVKSRCD